MAKLTKRIAELDLYAISTDVLGAEAIGAKIEGLNGKEFALATVDQSGTSLVAGNLLQESIEDTQFENMAIGTAGVVGDKFLQVTNGTTTVTAQHYRGGSISVYTAGTIAIGDEYTIMDVTGTLTTGGAMNVWLDRPLRTAATTATKVNMKRNLYSGVIQFPATTPTGVPVGVAIYAATVSTTADVNVWIQTKGAASVLSDGSVFAVGSAVGTPSGTAGAITVYAAATTKTLVGDAREAAASAHAISVNLRL